LHKAESPVFAFRPKTTETTSNSLFPIESLDAGFEKDNGSGGRFATLLPPPFLPLGRNSQLTGLGAFLAVCGFELVESEVGDAAKAEARDGFAKFGDGAS
jgi:hypothetical protein